MMDMISQFIDKFYWRIMYINQTHGSETRSTKQIINKFRYSLVEYELLWMRLSIIFHLMSAWIKDSKKWKESEGILVQI